jgi:hypothetical protein
VETFGVVVYYAGPPLRVGAPPVGEVLKLNGVGFKSFLHGGVLVCGLGYSHYLGLLLPLGEYLRARRGTVAVPRGVTSTRLEYLRRPDPYKGRGVYSLLRGKPSTKPGKRR